MPVCPKCRSRFATGTEWCAACDVVLLDVVSRSNNSGSASRGVSRPVPPTGDDRRSAAPAPGPATRYSGSDQASVAVQPAPLPDSAGTFEGEGDRMVLLLEEPLPEMAGMICEFLQNCGIRSIAHADSIGLLYRLPAPGAPMSRSRVYVMESDYQEARELIAHFFDRS